jgi:hypothetical protein
MNGAPRVLAGFMYGPPARPRYWWVFMYGPPACTLPGLLMGTGQAYALGGSEAIVNWIPDDGSRFRANAHSCGETA